MIDIEKSNNEKLSRKLLMKDLIIQSSQNNTKSVCLTDLHYNLVQNYQWLPYMVDIALLELEEDNFITEEIEYLEPEKPKHSRTCRVWLKLANNQ